MAENCANLKIVTAYVFPPIPTRKFDWCAYREGCEESGGYGWGETSAEAVEDLNRREAALAD